MCSDTNSQKAILMEKQSSPFLCFFSDELKVRFLFAMEKRKKKIPLHSLCKVPVGHDKPWTHHWLRLHLCGMMQMMTNSFIPHHACAANRCNTQGWARLGTWLRGWAAWLNHSEGACYRTVRPLSLLLWLGPPFTCIQRQRSPLSAAMCVMIEALFPFVTGWACQFHSGPTHVSVWQ